MTLFVPRPSGGPLPAPQSHRALHLRRLYTVLHLCLLRGDHARARTAWRILVRCREMSWEDLWRIGLGLNVAVEPSPEDPRAAVEQKEVDHRNGDFIEGLMRGGGRMSIPLLQLHVNHLLSLSPPKPEQALERLEIFLPGLPFAQSPTLHALAAMCALALSVEHRSRGAPPNLTHHRQALAYIQKAISLLNTTTASTLGNTTSPPENKTFYSSLLQLVQESARWGEAEQAELRESRVKAHRRGESSSTSPPPSSAAGSGQRAGDSDDSDGETVGGESWRRVKREQVDRASSLSANSELESTRHGSVQSSETSEPLHVPVQDDDAGMEGVADVRGVGDSGGREDEGDDDDDDNDAYDMDED